MSGVETGAATGGKADERFDAGRLDWAKGDGLLPAIVQHADSGRVLMLGYMDRDALERTLESGQVTFFSRSRQQLWTKGETSGNVLAFAGIATDCDGDALLVQARPAGPTCHLGRVSCFEGAPAESIAALDAIVAGRRGAPADGSYTARLFAGGVRRIAQKVGEEGVEVALAAVAQDDAAFVGEAADLVYHLLVLLHARGCSLADVQAELARRGARRTAGEP